MGIEFQSEFKGLKLTSPKVDLSGYATLDYVDEALKNCLAAETDPNVFNWAKRELFNKANLVDPAGRNSFITIDGVEYYRYNASAQNFEWYNPYEVEGSVTITARMVNQYNQNSTGSVSALVLYYNDETKSYFRINNKEVGKYTTDANKTLVKITGNYDLENWVLLDMSVMSIKAEFDMDLPISSGGSAEQVQPDWEQSDNTQPDYIKNRPFYSESGEKEVFPATDILFPNELSNISFDDTIDGKYTLYVGDMVFSGAREYFGFMPWYDWGIKFEDGSYSVWNEFNASETLQNLSGTYTVKVTAEASVIAQIDNKYIPDLDYVSYSKNQFLSDEQKQQVKDNIGISGSNTRVVLFEGSEYANMEQNKFHYIEKDLPLDIWGWDYDFNYLEISFNFTPFTQNCTYIIPFKRDNNRIQQILYYNGKTSVEVITDRYSFPEKITLKINTTDTNDCNHFYLTRICGITIPFNEVYL